VRNTQRIRYRVHRRRRIPPRFPKTVYARVFNYEGHVSDDANVFENGDKVGIYKLVRIARVKKTVTIA